MFIIQYFFLTEFYSDKCGNNVRTSNKYQKYRVIYTLVELSIEINDAGKISCDPIHLLDYYKGKKVPISLLFLTNADNVAWNQSFRSTYCLDFDRCAWSTQ